MTATDGPLDLDAPQQLDAVDVGHPDIEQHHRRMLALDEIHHLGGAAGIEHAESFVAQNSPQ